MAAKLPNFQTDDNGLQLLQDRWAAIIDPVLKLPQNSSVILKNVVLSSSAEINHTLGRPLQGWQIIRQRGKADIFDRQETNTLPDKTLLLSASSGISVDILVF